MRVDFGTRSLRLIQGDLVQQTTDALVNAANSRLIAGGGVDGALHRAAGPELQQELSARYPAGCPTGQAVVTSGCLLPVVCLIHAVAPIWQGGHRGERELLQSAVRNSLELACAQGCRSVSLPALGAGAYGYPRDLAAEHILGAIRDFCLSQGDGPSLEVSVVLFDSGAYAAFARVLEEMVE